MLQSDLPFLVAEDVLFGAQWQLQGQAFQHQLASHSRHLRLLVHLEAATLRQGEGQRTSKESHFGECVVV